MAKETDKVVGVFLDESHARMAIKALQAAGYKAQIADESAINAFRNSGFENEVVDMYKNRHQEGNTIVTTSGSNQGDKALGIMLQNGAEYINLSSREGTSGDQKMSGKQDAAYYRNLETKKRQYGELDQTTGRRRDAEQTRLQLREETLTATKQAVKSGDVEIRKVVHEKQQEVPVNLTHEEVYIERKAVDREMAPGEMTDMKDEVIRVEVYEEQAQLQKQARVREEVTIGKKGVQEQQNLVGTARHEHAEVVQTGDVKVSGDASMTKKETTTESATTSTGDAQPYNSQA